MNLVVHKNEMVSRTNNMLFYNYTFTGKERDEETGYNYFGARYYDSDLSGLFLSVDPMSDKYPSVSPYAYCMWNPMRLVDPDGDSIIVIGSQSEEIVKQLQTNNMNVSIDRNGFLKVNLLDKGYPTLSDDEQVIYEAIVSDKLNMTIVAESSAVTKQGIHYFAMKDNGINYYMETQYGGSFCGAYKNDLTGKVDSYSFIDIDYMTVLGYDQGVVHEISENYHAGLLVLSQGENIPYADTKKTDERLRDSHRRAIPERLDYGMTYKFGPRRGQLKLYKMKSLFF